MSKSKGVNRIRLFATVYEAVSVLGLHTTKARLKALQSLGIDFTLYKHWEIAERVAASREKVTRAMCDLGMRRHPRKL